MGQKIIVIDVQTKPVKNGGTLYTVIDEKGSKFSGFHESLAGIQKGSTIEAEIEVSGKFCNIKEWKLLTPATVAPATVAAGSPQPTKTNGGARSPEERTSIERQTCLKCACEIHGGTDSIEVILNNAGMMYRWLSGESVPVKTQSDDEWDKMQRPETRLVPGCDAWIISKVKELRIVESELLSYMDKNLHIPVENTLGETVKKLTDIQRADLAKAINAREKTKRPS